MELIERIFDRTAKIAVVGDGMIDSDYQILSERLNPEGAMPLWLSQTDKPSFSRPGGAARVAHLLKNFHSDIRYFGIINEELAEILESNEISSRYSEVTNCVVPIKKRFYCGGTPVFRWDVERPQLGLAVDELSHHQHLLRRKLAEFQADVVIFSDYGKGVFDDTTRWLDYIGDAISIVDAKYPPIKKWEGCHIFKPNAKEASEISGIPDPIQQCRYFSEVLGSTAIVVTDGGNGFYGSVGHRSFQFRPDVKREAKSVVGAGDAFSGILAICQAHCIDLIESAQIAWTGANVYVSRLDNRPISIHDILFELEVKRVEPKWLRYRDFNLVFTNGVFDLMHVGHIDFLKRAKSLGDKLVVALNSDESVSTLKGSARPVQSLSDRMQIIEALGFVDYVISFNSEQELERVLEEIRPDVLVKGKEYEGKSITGRRFASQLCLLDHNFDTSTTIIVEKILNKCLDAVN